MLLACSPQQLGVGRPKAEAVSNPLPKTEMLHYQVFLRQLCDPRQLVRRHGLSKQVNRIFDGGRKMAHDHSVDSRRYRRVAPGVAERPHEVNGEFADRSSNVSAVSRRSGLCQIADVVDVVCRRGPKNEGSANLRALIHSVLTFGDGTGFPRAADHDELSGRPYQIF